MNRRRGKRSDRLKKGLARITTRSESSRSLLWGRIRSHVGISGIGTNIGKPGPKIKFQHICAPDMNTVQTSVVIATHNRAHTIESAVMSVVDQTVAPHEIIIVDDGSTDDTRRIIRGLDHPKLIYIYQQNAGPGPARNAGIERATGNWIAFLDSDDVWSRNKLEAQVEVIRRRPEVDFIHSNRKQRRADGYEDSGRLGVGEKELTDRIFLLRHWAVNLSTVMIKESLLSAVGGYFMTERRTCEDYELWWRAVILSRAIGYVEEPTVTVNLSHDGISRSGDPSQRIADNIYSMGCVINWIERMNGSPEYAQILRRRQIAEYRNLFVESLKAREIHGFVKDIITCIQKTSLRGMVTALCGACRTMSVKAVERYMDNVLGS